MVRRSAALRIVFGGVMLAQAVRHLWPLPGGNMLTRMFAAHLFHFPYRGLDWLPPPTALGMQVVFVILGLASLGMLLGLCYRSSAIVVFLTWTYFFLSDQAHYQNHYYLISLMAAIFIVSPAARCYSIDAWLRRSGGRASPAAQSIPFWPVLLMQAQLVCMYFFASIAKLEADWLSGVPIQGGCGRMISWLEACGIAAPLTGAQLAFLLAWAGLLFDFAIGPLLLTRRTRPLGVALVLAFHLSNKVIFGLAMLPYLGAGSTIIFCEPDFPRRFLQWIRRPYLPAPDWRWLIGGAAMVPLLGALLGWRSTASPPTAAKPFVLGRITPALAALFIALNAIIPLRHWVIAGDPDWTEEGYRFSWRMMQRTQSQSHVDFRLQPAGLISTTADGATAFDWRRWPGEPPAIALVAASATAPGWEHLPDLVLIYEPCLGVRAIGNPYSALADTRDPHWHDRLAERWQAATGRRPTIRPAISLDAALANCQQKLAAAAQPAPADDLAVQLRRLHGARAIATLDSPTLANLIELIDVAQLLVDEQQGAMIRRELAMTAPFALQGGAMMGRSFCSTTRSYKPRMFGRAPFGWPRRVNPRRSCAIVRGCERARGASCRKRCCAKTRKAFTSCGITTAS